MFVNAMQLQSQQKQPNLKLKTRQVRFRLSLIRFSAPNEISSFFNEKKIFELKSSTKSQHQEINFKLSNQPNVRKIIVLFFPSSLLLCPWPTTCWQGLPRNGGREWSSAGNTKGGSITVPLTSCLTGLDESVLQIKTKIVSCHTANSKPVKQKVNGKVILPPLVFPIQGWGRGACSFSLNLSSLYLCSLICAYFKQ